MRAKKGLNAPQSSATPTEGYLTTQVVNARGLQAKVTQSTAGQADLNAAKMLWMRTRLSCHNSHAGWGYLQGWSAPAVTHGGTTSSARAKLPGAASRLHAEASPRATRDGAQGQGEAAEGQGPLRRPSPSST